MKKKTYIGALILIAAAVAISVAIVIFVFNVKPPGTAEEKAVTVYDSQGAVLLQTTSVSDLYDADCWAYLELVVEEAAQIIAEQDNCSTADARGRLFTKGYEIHTAFDSVAFAALKEAKRNDCNFACAITDLKGNLLATYCEDTNGKQINYLPQRRSPYSAFKALSVYTPAVENGVVNWSSLYQDSPYKQMKDENGTLRDWPANVTNTYSQEKVTAYEALRTSLNTVAVKCLADLGVSKSVEFLQTQFEIPLKQEEFVAKEYGEEEVIGSIALGYLEVGVTPAEMAGYYQIFANGGMYSAPKTVSSITLEHSELYVRQDKQKQVVRPETADLMNKLLQGVVATGGTGVKANCGNVQVAGKTGTGDDYADNWFVGVTPGYSLAVWHGQSDSNHAAEMFSMVMGTLYSKLPGANTKFVTHKNLSQLVYCTHSGKAFSENCSVIDTGYYTNEAALPVCDVCGKN